MAKLFSITPGRVAVSNVSGLRCVSDCRSRGREFDPGPLPYFRGDWSWKNFYGHSPPFRWFIQEGLLSVTSESMCTNYWLTPCSSLPWKKYGYSSWTDRGAMTVAVDLGRKATKQNKIFSISWAQSAEGELLYLSVCSTLSDRMATSSKMDSGQQPRAILTFCHLLNFLQSFFFFFSFRKAIRVSNCLNPDWGSAVAQW